jgi:hypothetical protein
MITGDLSAAAREARREKSQAAHTANTLRRPKVGDVLETNAAARRVSMRPERV